MMNAASPGATRRSAARRLLLALTLLLTFGNLVDTALVHTHGLAHAATLSAPSPSDGPQPASSSGGAGEPCPLCSVLGAAVFVLVAATLGIFALRVEALGSWLAEHRTLQADRDRPRGRSPPLVFA